MDTFDSHIIVTLKARGRLSQKDSLFIDNFTL